MTINVLPDHVMRTVFLSLTAAIVVFVGMLLLTTLHSGDSRCMTTSLSNLDTQPRRGLGLPFTRRAN